MKCALLLTAVFLIFTGILFSDQPDNFSIIKYGDHVEIILKNNNNFKGLVKLKIKNKIVLDISYDDPRLKGTITFYRSDIKKIDALVPLSDLQKRQSMTEKKKQLKEYRKESRKLQSELPDETTSKVKTQPSDIPQVTIEELSEEEQQKKLLALLKKFPPSEGWGMQKINDIKKKMDLFRSAKEKEFIEVFNDWTKAVELQKKEERRKLLEKFSPDKGWGEQKYTEASTRFLRMGVGPSKEEQEFIDRYKDWQKALEEKKEEVKKEEKDKK